jgi:hypothetical protein
MAARKPPATPQPATPEPATPSAFKGTAHDLLVAIYQDESQDIAARIDAAKAAIGYEKPRLATNTIKGDADNPLHTVTQIILCGPDDDNDETTAPASAPRDRRDA